jgi:NCS1 family nucleobase:cation symporter-1
MTDRNNRLTNDDLLPVKPEKRTWGWVSIMTVWFGCVHNLGQYTLGATFLLLGVPAWQLIIAYFISFMMTFVFIQLSARPAQRFGIPFPVFARLSFGVFGANLPAIIRCIAAIAWYGIQTYLASRAVLVLIMSVEPGVKDHLGPSIVGLPLLGWVAFLGLWSLQLLVASHGMETIRRFQVWAGLIITAVMTVLAVGLIVAADGHIDWNYGNDNKSFLGQLGVIFAAACLSYQSYTTLQLNIGDFTRFSPTMRQVTIGNIWGLPINGVFFGLLTTVSTLGGVVVYGELIADPTDLLARTNNHFLVAVGAAMFIFATIGANVVANAVSAAYDLSNIFPKYISFNRGIVVASILSLFCLPWKIYGSAVAMTYFLGTVGAMVGPVFGVMVADYYLVKRQRVDIDQLYSVSTTGRYFYSRGVNPRALIGFAVGAAVAIPIALVPALHDASYYTWFIGAGLAALVYVVIEPNVASDADLPTPAERLPEAQGTAS